jgi:hypothetical protein
MTASTKNDLDETSIPPRLKRGDRFWSRNRDATNVRFRVAVEDALRIARYVP